MKHVITLLVIFAFLLSVSTVQAGITESGTVTPSALTWGPTTTPAYVGILSAGTGPASVTIDGGTDVLLPTTGTFGVGWHAQTPGTFTIDGNNASDVTQFQAGATFVGYTGTGSMTIDGNATAMIQGSGTFLGASTGGSGTLNITGGAYLTNTSRINVAFGGSSTGTLVVGTENSTGPTSTLHCADIEVGRTGATGSVTVWDDGYINALANIRLGRFGTSVSSTMKVSGGHVKTNSILYGYNSKSNILIEEGGLVEASDVMLANSSGSTCHSHAVVTGAGSKMVASANVVVGVGSLASLVIANGGEVEGAVVIIDGDTVEDPADPVDSRIDILGGLLTIGGQHDADLATFLSAIQGSDTINVLTTGYALVPVTSATAGVDYTLTYDAGAGTTTLQGMTVPEPGTIILLLGLVFAGLILRKK